MGCLFKANGLYSRMTVGAVLLAAGAGSRLGGRPKALLELGGVPLVLRQLIALSGAGVDEVAVVLGHHARGHRGRGAAVPDHAGAQPRARRRPGLVGAPGPERAVAEARRGDRRARRPAADRRAGHRRADRRLQEARRRVHGGAARDVRRRRGRAGQPGDVRRRAARGVARGRRRPRLPQVARARIRSACTGSTPTTGATASTSIRPRTSSASRPAPGHRLVWPAAYAQEAVA